jgi:hypothetical protein
MAMPQKGPGYHTCGNIKGKEKNSQKGKGEKGEKGNFLRFISTVILPMIKKSRKSPKIYLHNILDRKNQELCRFISIMNLKQNFTGLDLYPN